MHRWLPHLLRTILTAALLAGCARTTTVAPSAPPAAETPQPTAAADPNLPPSAELISSALEAGEMDAETALTYQVFAAFSDPRLPAAYRSGANSGHDSHVLDEVQARWGALSPDAQETLLPFLIPPVYAGSWASPDFRAQAETEAKLQPSPTPTGEDLPSGPAPTEHVDIGPLSTEEFGKPCSDVQLDLWDSVSAMHSPVRFWWRKDRPQDGAYAQRMLAAMDNDIWPKLTGLMGRVPKPDGELPCNGGSADLDVYVVAGVSGGLTVTYPPGCKNAPVFIEMDPTAGEAFLTHEFMHAVQWAFEYSAGCKLPEYSWMSEATADWSIDYVYPNDNEEHKSVPSYYNPKAGPPVLYLKDGAHEYGAYLFFFFLARHFGQPEIIRTAWENTESMASVAAVDKAIPGGYDAVWPLFAVDNVIEPPYDDYQVWDNLNQKPSGNWTLTKGEVGPNQTYAGQTGLSPLVHYYDWYTFPEDARLVTFFNGLAFKREEVPINTYMGNLPIKDGTTQYKFTQRSPEEYKGLKIQAYFKVAGDVEWQLEDWTDKPYVSFCRDAQSERLTDLIVISSNSSQDEAGIRGDGNLLQVSDVGCYRYGGSASFLYYGEGEGGIVEDDLTIPNVAFERTEAHPNIPYPILHFKIAEGQLNRTYKYTSKTDSCTGSGALQTPLSSSPTMYGNDLYILAGAVSGASVRRYSGNANTNQPISVAFTGCDEAASASIQPLISWFMVDMLSQILKKTYTVPVGGEIKGKDKMFSNAEDEMAYEWNLVPLQESAGSGSADSNKPPSAPPGVPPAAPGGSPDSPASPSLPDVANYPNMVTAQQSSSGMMFFTTADSVETILAFYEKTLPDSGWLAIPPSNPAPGQPLMRMFTKGQKMLTLMVNPGDEGMTTVMVNVVGQ